MGPRLRGDDEVKSVIASQRSRECAPDDRLRDAIHEATKSKSGMLRRFAPRNDGKIQLRILPARCARVLLEFPALFVQRAQCYPKRGAGNAGRSTRPQPRV